MSSLIVSNLSPCSAIQALYNLQDSGRVFSGLSDFDLLLKSESPGAFY
jgi:hypothetical protein